MGGGWWVLDFTKLMQSHLPTKVEVEVEDELGKIEYKIVKSENRDVMQNFLRYIICHFTLIELDL